MDPFTLNTNLVIPPERLEEVVDGIRRGIMYQDGGVIRRSEDATLVTFLKAGGESIDPSSVGGLLGNLGSVASMLNLGVTVAGFAVMYHKLSKIEDGIRLLDTAMRDGFDAVSGKLDRAEARLIGLQLLSLQAATDLERVERKVDRVSAQIDIAQFVPLAQALEQLADVRPGESAHDAAWYRAHAERAQAVRLYCVAMLDRTDLGALPVSDPRFVAARVYLQMAGLATVSEARCLRAAGDTQTAIRRLKAASERLLPMSQGIVLRLLDGTPDILGARSVETSLGRADAEALARHLHPGTGGGEALAASRTAWTAKVADGDKGTLEHLRTLRGAADEWKLRAEVARQTAEVYELLETVRAEYEFLEAKKLRAENWEHVLAGLPEGQVVMVAASLEG